VSNIDGNEVGLTRNKLREQFSPEAEALVERMLNASIYSRFIRFYVNVSVNVNHKFI